MAYISNLLTHWVGTKLNDDDRYHVLAEEILKNKLLLYSYNNIEFGSKYGGINKGAWGAQMVCFADIPFSEVEKHCKKYSQFGISFSKAYLANSCVVPVWYALSPFIYEAYSYLYHTIHGLKSLIDGEIISEGKSKDKTFSVNEYLQELHNIIALAQDYSDKDFNHVERTLGANDYQKNFFKQTNAYYFEREWRSIYRNGDAFTWNKEVSGKHYFEFSEEAVAWVIVPQKYVNKLKQDIKKYFKPDNVPNVIAYEDLKFL